MSGWTKAWKKELRSDIWLMPPLYQRVFFWLRQTAEHKTTLFPTRRRYGIWTRAGQVITSTRRIADGVSWEVGGEKKTPNSKTIRHILWWLEINNCLTISSNTFGMFISLTNWGIYQSDEEKEVTLDGHTLRSKRKDLKTMKNKKQDFALPEWLPEEIWDAFVKMRRSIKKPLTEYAKGLAIKKLIALKAEGNQPIAVLEQSILNSWQGLWPVKNTTPQESTADQKRTAEWTELLS